MSTEFPRRRLRAALVHLALSAFVAGAASLLVFLLWFPRPFSAIAGGTQLFVLLVVVDVVLGPALTAVVASPGKARQEFLRDLGVIVTLQLAAFAYGLHTMALARPVALVHEVDLLRVVTAVDVEASALSRAPAPLRGLSWRGPRLLVAVKPETPSEQLRSIELAMSGVHLAFLPEYWRDYRENAAAVWRSARPVAELAARYPTARTEIDQAAAAAGLPPQSLRFVPLLSRRASWVALVAEPGASIVGYLPLDGQF